MHPRLRAILTVCDAEDIGEALDELRLAHDYPNATQADRDAYQSLADWLVQESPGNWDSRMANQ